MVFITYLFYWTQWSICQKINRHAANRGCCVTSLADPDTTHLFDDYSCGAQNGTCCRRTLMDEWSVQAINKFIFLTIVVIMSDTQNNMDEPMQKDHSGNLDSFERRHFICHRFDCTQLYTWS